MVSREERLGRTLVELADTLVDDFDIVDLLALVVERCVELLDASAAGLLLADARGTLHLMAATSEATELVELFQIQNDEGPCLACFRAGAPVLVPDLATEGDRWPLFVPVATGAGFRAAHALPLRLRGNVLGALNLFRAEPGRLARSDVTTAQALADVATIAILQHQAAREAQALTEQLRAALDSRIAIEQAKGVIAERARVDMAEAFARLRGYARANQRLLSDVAQEVVDGTLPSTALMG
jgi:GAF domain-containing protein